MKHLLTLAWSLLFLLLTLPAQAAYTVVSTSSTSIGGLTKTSTVVQDGVDPVNRFTMHHVVKTGVSPFGAILMMPGGNTNFSNYEFDDVDNYQNSLVGYLANHEVDVWGYDPRSKGMTSSSCTVPFSCPQLVPWGIATVVQDANYIRGQITSTGMTPAIGGLSLGAMTSAAAVNSNPTGYAGLLFWEGVLYSADLNTTVGNTVNCTQAQTELSLGFYNNPTMASLLALPPAVFRPVATASQPCPTGYVPGYTLLTGNGTCIHVYKYRTSGEVPSDFQRSREHVDPAGHHVLACRGSYLHEQPRCVYQSFVCDPKRSWVRTLHVGSGSTLRFNPEGCK